jgi:hypothetical protein
MVSYRDPRATPPGATFGSLPCASPEEENWLRHAPGLGLARDGATFLASALLESITFPAFIEFCPRAFALAQEL